MIPRLECRRVAKNERKWRNVGGLQASCGITKASQRPGKVDLANEVSIVGVGGRRCPKWPEISKLGG